MYTYKNVCVRRWHIFNGLVCGLLMEEVGKAQIKVPVYSLAKETGFHP